MKRLLTLALIVGVALTAFASPAWADTTIVVDDGSDCKNPDATTINGGVALASPGDTILVCAGTYEEAVTIPSAKHDIRLLAKGAPGTVVVDANGSFAGFRLVEVTGVLIEGFTVREGHEANIVGTNADFNTIRKNTLTAAGHDGIELTAGSSGNLVEHNLSIDNFSPIACGIQITGAGSTGNVVRHNVVINNAFGVQIAAGATGNVVFHNLAIDNRRVGVRNINSNGTLIEDNRAFNNVGVGAPPDEGWGIAVLGTSSGVTVARNHAFANTVDLFTNALVAVNTFENNHCNTSVPAGLCEQTEGEGDSGQT